MSAHLTFDAESREFVLDAFGKTVDGGGYIVEKADPSQKVLTTDGEEIELSSFAGIRKGSEVFIKSDIASLVQASEFIA